MACEKVIRSDILDIWHIASLFGRFYVEDVYDYIDEAS